MFWGLRTFVPVIGLQLLVVFLDGVHFGKDVRWGVQSRRAWRVLLTPGSRIPTASTLKQR